MADYVCSKANQMHQRIKFILFCNVTLHVSDGISVHRHHPDDGRKDRPKHVECHYKINIFDAVVRIVGFNTGIILRSMAL